MKKEFMRIFHSVFLQKSKRKLLMTGGVFLFITICGWPVFAQNTQTVRGTVTDEKQEPLIGVTVVLKNTTNGTTTNIDGNFNLTVPAGGPQTLVFSFVGMVTQEISVTGAEPVKVILKESSVELDEVVVVGFGQQKKESVVGAITQTSGKVLERAGGVSNVGAALTGNLPGVITMSSTGMPGEEDPSIVIRGRSSWNNTDPLVLVDGVERPMSSIDINSIESISVLKDASATAVFGVRGANGVILINTKRGQEGRARIGINLSATMKTPSQLPTKYDAYDALMMRNQVIESELGLKPESWSSITPQEIIEKYRNPANVEEAERYPNVDWKKELLKDFAMSYNANLNISGGTKFVRYFTNFDFQREGDLYRTFDNNRGYQAGYGYNRLNVRSNLDFSLTNSTTLRVNLSGSHGVKKGPNDGSFEYTVWAALYGTAPDAFIPRYSDGVWGYYQPSPVNVAQNSMETLANKGVGYTTTNRLNTDFTLEQDLGMFLKGLSIRGRLAFDNSFQETSRGINDIYNSTQHKWISPATGETFWERSIDGNNKFDFQEGIKWSATAGSMQNNSVYRRINYSVQLNYGNTFGKHSVAGMGDFSREQYATGSMIPNYRENWVFRVTYDFAKRYFAEYNGAYNGSEKFAPENRFAFFQSGALGWMVSEEPMVKSLNINWLDMLKLRASYGQIGDDGGGGAYRFLYMDNWQYTTTGRFRQSLTGVSSSSSPYGFYIQSALGNPNIQWETVTKLNLGADVAVFRSLVSATFNYFYDQRRNIFIAGGSRAIPPYFGATAPTANLGSVDTKGFELELRFNKQFNRNLRLWANVMMTHAVDKVIFKDDPTLKAEYQKSQDKSNSQAYAYVDYGYYNNYDELYGSTAHEESDDARMPGNYVILDYNADGVINSLDNIPYSYSGTPQNTYNLTLGFEYKGFSGFIQFYGVTNVSRQVTYSSLGGVRNLVFDEGSYWSKYDVNADVPLPRWYTVQSAYAQGTHYMYDGSYIRLKNAELAYSFAGKNWIKKLGISDLRIYVNGNNLWLWTRMPDDRESNFATGGVASQGTYPTVKRYNLGLRISL